MPQLLAQINIGAASYGLGAALYLLLTLLLLTAWRGRLQGGLLLAASGASTAWCAAAAVYALTGRPAFPWVLAVEVLRDGLWVAFLVKALSYARDDGARGFNLRFTAIGVAVVSAGVLALLALRAADMSAWLPAEVSSKGVMFGHVLLAVAGLSLVEQLYRNTRPDHRWAIKFLCLGVGGVFAYDFFLYSNGVLFNRLDSDLWDARGVVNAIVVPLVAVSAARNPQWSLSVFVSRHIVFHSAALVGAGVYLLLMSAVGYYIRSFGGTWGGAAQAAFLFGAGVVLMMILFSGQVRSRAKVFVSKHFFRNKYDYREEWLRFTHLLSNSALSGQLQEEIVRGIAEIVESPGGCMWVRQGSGHFHPVATWNAVRPQGAVEPPDGSLVRFMEQTGWVVFLDEYEENPELYGDLRLPEWLQSIPRAGLIVPLMQRDELLGFVVLLRSSTKTKLDWEDNDLLKTVGRQAASHVAVMRMSEALAEARQFEAFNRLSAYVVHDLKNVVAQLSLVSSNAKRHMHSPGFIEDAVSTVENATTRMNRMLTQLRKGRLEETTTRLVNLKPIVAKVTAACAARQPAPTLEVAEGTALIVTADPDRMADILEHIVQNAQEATPADGRVGLRVSGESGWALIDVEDSGCGMDQQFISERLFRPFDTTKGNAGMGIGVYEAREFVRALGGEMEVRSSPGEGTRFRLRVPLADGGAAKEGPQTPNVERIS